MDKIKADFLNHIKNYMEYLLQEKDIDEVSKIESMTYFILNTLDNCSGFEHELKLSSSYKGKEVIINNEFLHEEFFKLNNTCYGE